MSNINLHKIIFFYAILGVIGWVWIFFADLPCQIFGFKGIVEALILGFIFFSLSLYLLSKYTWAKDLEELFLKFLTPIALPQIALIAAVSALSEELFFRGAVQNQFGIIVASLLFGIVHFPMNKKMVPWTISATVMGFVLGSLYLYTGNLLSPILLHFLINFLNIWSMNQRNLSVKSTNPNED